MTPPAIHHLVSWSGLFDIYIVVCDDNRFYVSAIGKRRSLRVPDRNAVRHRTSGQAMAYARSLQRKL